MLIGYPAAEKYLDFDGHPSTIYVEAATSRVRAIDSLLAAHRQPGEPVRCHVTQPSAALAAQADAKGAFNALFLGLGAVALLVGAIGVANIMVISVLERRSEIGLRRALGATKGHIRIQFLTEAILLAATGGVAGVAAGVARHRHLRPAQRLGHRHPARGLGRRHRRRPGHRRPRRAAPRNPRRPPLTHPGPMEQLTGPQPARSHGPQPGARPPPPHPQASR